jgi:hypothetical protein
MWFKKIYIPKSNIKSKDIELIQLKNIWDLVKEISKL